MTEINRSNFWRVRGSKSFGLFTFVVVIFCCVTANWRYTSETICSIQKSYSALAG